MANYNLYNALDLNEDWSCDELRDHLDGEVRRLEREGLTPDSPELDQVLTARRILGRADHRRTYDEALRGPDGVVDIAWLRRLAFEDGWQAGGASEGASGPAGAAAPAPFASSASSVSSTSGAGAGVPFGGAHAGGQSGTPFAQAGTAPAPASTGTTSFHFDMARLAVAPGRRRSESIMWAIGRGIIVLVWLYAGFGILTMDDSSGSGSSGLVGLDNALDEASQALSMLGVVAFALVNTVAMIAVLQFVWTVRCIVGARMTRTAQGEGQQ